MWELDIVQEGRWCITTPSSRIELEKGQAVLIRPKTIHEARVLGEENCLCMALHFISSWHDLTRIANKCLTLEWRGHAFGHQFFDVRGEGPLAIGRRRALLALLLMECVDPTRDIPQSPVSFGDACKSDLVRHVVHAMQRTLRTGYDIDELARVTGYSPSYLRRLFQKEAGLTLREAHHRLRLEEAQRLLLSSSLKVSAIANLVGFKYVPKFNHFFRVRTGCTPSQFIREHPSLGVRVIREPGIQNDEITCADQVPVLL